MGSIFEVFKAFKRVVTAEVIQRIDTTADGERLQCRFD